MAFYPTPPEPQARPLGPGQLEIQAHVADGRHTVCLAGELDLATVSELEAAIRRPLSVANEIVLDLKGLSFIDSMGLRCILACQASCRRAGVAFLLTPGKSQTRRLFEITGLLERLPFTDDMCVRQAGPAVG